MADVLVMRDVACAGYVAGCNTTFFAETDPGKYSLSAAANNIMKRLSFADDAGARYGSMLAYPAFEEQFRSGHLDTVMSITTRLLPWEVTSATGGDHNSFPGGEKMFAIYSQLLNLRQVHFGEDMKARSQPRLVLRAPFAHLAPPFGRPPRTRTSSRRVQHCTTTRTHTAGAPLACSHTSPCFAGSTNNATCFLGPHRIFDPFTKSFMNLIPGQGHVRRHRCSRMRHRSTLRSPPLRLLRSLARTRFQAMRAGVGGCARLLLPALFATQCSRPRKRVQESVSLKTARDTLVPLELAQHAQMVYSKR